MRSGNRKTMLAILGLIFLLVSQSRAQAPPSIQFFKPGGGLPDRELRFTLTRSDGRQEFLFTDTKGKFQFSSDLLREGDYTIYIEGDKRSFETTVQRFRLVRTLSYIPVFLQPLRRETPPKTVVNVAEFDAKVPEEARAAYERGRQAVSEKNVEAAISAFTQALSLHPQYLRALNDLGVLYLGLERLDEAAATFTQALSLNPKFHLLRLNLGIVRTRQRRYTEAVEVLSALVKEQPSLSAARVWLTEGLIASKQWDEAGQQIREALKDQTLEVRLQAEAHVKLGVLLNQAERYEAAAAALEKAMKLDPTSAFAQLYLGAAYLQLKKLPEAEQHLLQAYALGGARVGSAQLLLGQLYYNQQKTALAIKAFEQYLADMPNAPNAAQIKGFIERLKISTPR